MNKIVVIILSIVIGLALIPIMLVSLENSKQITDIINYEITDTDGVLTTNLTSTSIKKLINNYENVTFHSSLLLDGSIEDSFVDITLDDPFYFEETILNDVDLTLALLPIYIRAGDTLTLNLPDVVSNVQLRTYLSNDWDSSLGRYGFSWWNAGLEVYIAGTSYDLTSGTWDEPVIEASFTNTNLDWAVVGDVGTLTFLTDWPEPIINLYNSNGEIKTDFSVNDSYWVDFISFDLTSPASQIHFNFVTATLSYDVGTETFTSDTALLDGNQSLSLTYEIEMNNTISTLLDILPILFVVIIVVGAVSFIVIKRS